eukprot:TRINITY_DN35712_c0_g1_i1.p1 TRINITY_DN35712_c0_g1~~TRINITY_DN35712_c0_g1_i1.p1  ORF type:complete len:1167 (+),score=375.90 TRINITY_DN35712_c0_g1_i1:74-3502(+)
MARIPTARWYTGDRLYAMTAVPGGRVFVGGASSGDVKVYDPRSGRLETALSAAVDEKSREGGHTDSVLTITYNKDFLFTAGADCLIMQWDMVTFQCLRAFRGHKGLIAALCLIPSELGTGLFSGSDDCTVKQWNTHTGKCVGTFGAKPYFRCMRLCWQGHTSAVNAVVATNQHLISGSMRVIKVWLQRGRKCINTIEAHTDAIWTLRLTGDGKLLSGSSDSTIKLWENITDRPVCSRVLTGHQGQVRDLLVHGPILFSASKDGTVAIWDTSTWKVGEVLTGHEKTVTAVTLQNNQLCTCSFDKHVNRWDLTSSFEAMNILQPLLEYAPFDLDEALRERTKRHEETQGRSEARYYSKEQKRKLLKMKAHDAIFHYEALPINFVIDKLEYKVEASYLVLDSFVFIPFLLMFIFFFYFESKVEQQYMIGRAATDVFEGGEIARQPWCSVVGSGQYWDNRESGFRPVCNPDAGKLKNEKRFGDISNRLDWESWMASVVFPGLWPGEGHADSSPPVRNPPLHRADYLIGALRVRTFRVKSDSCSPNSDFFGSAITIGPDSAALSGFYRQCWGRWQGDKNNEIDRSPYVCSETLSPCARSAYPPSKVFNRTEHVQSQKGVTAAWAGQWFTDDGFRYLGENALGGVRTAGQVSETWPAGGYAVEIPFASSPNDARDMLSTVIDNGFVDDVATRYVAVEYMTYTPYANYFSSHRYYVEVAAGGAWIPEGKIRHFGVWTRNFVGKMVFDLFFFVFVMFYVVQFARGWYQEWRASHSVVKYVLNAWNFQELLNLSVFMVTFAFRFAWWHLSIRYSDDVKMPPSPTMGYPFKLENIREIYLAQVYANSVNLVFTFLKVLRFVSLNDRLNILTRTVSHCRSNILGCLVLFVWTTFAYCLTGHSLYGGALFSYRSISSTFSTVWRMVGVGDFDYPELLNEQKFMTPLYFWSVQVLCLFILLNFIIAVLSDSFAAVSAETATLDLDATLRKTLRDVKEEILPGAVMRKLRLLKHRKTQTGLLDKVRQELREGFRNRMMTDEEVEAQEHRELLGEIFIDKEEYMAAIPYTLKNDLSMDFLQHVWLDLAWEYHKRLISTSRQEVEIRKNMAEDNAEEQVYRLRDYVATIQDVRGRLDDLRERVSGVVQTWNASGGGFG